MTIGAAEEHLEVHLLAHTHWDREWYRPATQFQQRLVALVDELLDAPAPSTFLLDGQAMVLEDYLEIRPERAADLSAQLRAGTIEAGPWYALADELIPSGEALVRNLLAGRRVLRGLRANAPPVLYCPDSFGHPGALPAIAAGFGCALIVVWRGYGGGRWPPGDTVTWRAADGTSALLYHLPRDGYEAGSHLPAEREPAKARWARLHAELAPRSTLGIALLPHGADHHAPQARQGEAIAALESVMAPDRLVHSGLTRFGAALADRGAARPLPQVEGELRDSYGYTWTLQGTLGTRAMFKRRYAEVERLLLRDAEPWAALARWSDGRARKHLLNRAWRSVLQCHPHDTLCGCVIDDVARAAAVRLDEGAAAAEGVRDAALDVLVGHDPVEARDHVLSWRSVAVLRNRAPRVRHGVAEVDVDVVLAEAPVGPGSGVLPVSPRRAPLVSLGDDAAPAQELDRRLVFAREESPRHYPRNRLVERRRVLVWVDQVPAYGLRLLSVREGRRRQRTAAVPPARSEGGVVGTGRDGSPAAIDNGFLRVSMDHQGVHLETEGRAMRQCLTIEGQRERGDLYTHSPVPETFHEAHLRRARVTARGPLRAELAAEWTLELPAVRLTSAAGIERLVLASRLTVYTLLQLEAGQPFVRIVVRGANQTTDSRVRLRLRTDVADPRVFADAAFGPVERRPVEVPADESAVEAPVPTGPLHRYLSLFNDDRGCTVFSDGLTEYESSADGSVAITMWRAVGELSRHDLPERPGHAGYPVATPGAQCRGVFEASLAIFPHGPRTSDQVASIETIADDALLPLVGHTWRTALTPPALVTGVELTGRGLSVSSIKESDDGEWTVLRCVNVLNEIVAGAWRHERLSVARLALLDETPQRELPVTDGIVAFEAQPRAIVTLLVR